MSNFVAVQNHYGSGFQNDRYFVFFGNKNLSAEALSTEFSSFSFLKIRQTHSDIIVPASQSGTTEADAHYSADAKQALLISTADCIPLMIACEKTQRVAAIHAGWRGVANQISRKTLQLFLNSGSTPESLYFFIGPHIQQPSFEVREDALVLLRSAQYGLSDCDYITPQAQSFFVDLEKILFSQLFDLLKQTPQILKVNADTKTNADYFSHRRDQTKQRNLSFIARL